MPKIQSINCHKAVNSRGDWTIDTIITLSDGTTVSQTVPEGASKGENEAVSVPAEQAVEVVSTTIKEALVGKDAENQEGIDRLLIDLDGTPNKSKLGGNSILSVSLGVAKATAISLKIELYEYIQRLYSKQNKSQKVSKFPTPLFNVINGGKHAKNNLSFQEFMVIPSPDKTFVEGMEIGVNIYHSLKKLLEEKGYEVEVGDEGGFAPVNLTADKALSLLREASAISYVPGKDIFFGLDIAAESFFSKSIYEIKEENITFQTNELANYYSKLLGRFEVIYLEDPFYEKDIVGWKDFYNKFSEKVLVVGDDLVVTNSKYLETAIKKRLIGAVIVKPNQVGTLTETLDFVKKAKEAGLSIIVSHRSGDTAEDTFIADLALAVEADFIKAGAPVRGERVAKYNRLLDIYNSNLAL